VAHIHHHGRSVPHDGEAQRHTELPGALPWAAELPHEVPVGIDDHDARRLAVEDVEIAIRVEGGAADLAECLPKVSVEGAHAVDLFVVGAERTVLAGQLDDLLGSDRVHRDDETKNSAADSCSYSHMPHNLSLHFVVNTGYPTLVDVGHPKKRCPGVA